MDQLLLKNYKKSLSQKYNAICLDIDGTLTKPNSKHIDDRVISYLANLLNSNIPIVFVTGRGETGLNDLKDDIINILKDKYKVEDKKFLKMYALINDGARLFYTDENSKCLLKENKYISDQERMQTLSHFNDKICKLFEKEGLKKYCDIGYSFDSVLNQIVNIRIVLKTCNTSIVNLVFELVITLLNKQNFSKLNVTVGIHKDQHVIQVGTILKNDAIKIVEKIIGIPENSMLRIGDCGDFFGNDFSMLDCPQGFSVDKVSGKNDACFPVIDSKNNILTGVEATIFILQKAKILSTICLESVSENNYRKNYSLIEKKINIGRKHHLKKFNDLVDAIFDTYDGINSIFDQQTGSIKFHFYEWELINDDNPLKSLWMTKSKNKLGYSLRDNDGVLLRGSKTYYYFLSRRIAEEFNSIDKKDLTTKEMVMEWYNNYKCFFKKCNQALIKVENVNNINNKKMILGILDNIRNYLLVNINQQLMLNYDVDTIMINLNNLSEDDLLNKMYLILMTVDKMMGNICFDKSYILNKKDIINELENIYKLSVILEELFLKSDEKRNYSKDFRAYREIDNFAENYITAALSIDKKENLYNQNIGVCGLCYGGIELPILFKIINPNFSDVSILKFNLKTSGYAKKQSMELRYFDIDNYGGIKLLGIDLETEYILLDDNLLTGKTMQLAINCLYDIGIRVKGLSIVRYPSANRISQMFLPGHGAVDYKCFFDFINGLCFPSPYSWRDENEDNLYEDSLGVFDLNRRKIIECLVKNHDYAEKSEVYKLKRKVMK